MRVLHLTTEFPPFIYGGLGTAVGGLAAASVRTGLEVTVLLVGGGGGPAYLGSPAAPGRVNRSASVGRAGRGVLLVPVGHEDAEETAVRLTRSRRADVLHLHVFWLWQLARRIRERTGVPLVYTVHSLDRAEYELGQGPPECLGQWTVQADVIAAADRVVALTRSEQVLIGEYCPSVRDRVRVVGNGIADSRGARDAVRRRRVNAAPLVLYAGRFVERKGVRELLKAVPRLLARVPNARVVLAGGHRHCSGEEMARYWLPADLERYGESVHFTGWLDARGLARWYATADVLVVPSWYEPFGMVVLEGMLYGLAIAASAIGGPREILDHERTGLLFPPRDAAALADTLARLIASVRLRRRLGRAAAREVRRTWLYSRVVDRMRAVYRELATEGS